MPFETPQSKSEDSDTKPHIKKEQKTFARDYFSYLRSNNIEGLRKLAKALEEEGRKKEAANVLAKACQVADVLAKAHQIKDSDN